MAKSRSKKERERRSNVKQNEALKKIDDADKESKFVLDIEPDN